MNENPVLRIVLIGALFVAAAFLVYTRVLAGAGSEPAAPAPSAAGATATPSSSEAASGAAPATGSATDPAATAPDPAAATGSAEPAASATPSTASGATAPPVAASAEFAAGPGLPKKVAAAYDRGKAVAILITKKKGLDDRALREGAGALRSRGDVVLFSVPVKKVSRYARITEGVDLSQVPALVVVAPRGGDDGLPTASVSYGFRGPESVVQAVDDALYKGRSLPYHPE